MSARTIEYENAVRKIIDLLPAKTMIKEFNEKEKIRLEGDKLALKLLEESLVKKLDSHDEIIKQVGSQVKEAKRFRETVLASFG